MTNIHQIIEETKGVVSNSAVIFYVWMKSKFNVPVQFEKLLEYGTSERHTRRYLSELIEADLIVSTRIPYSNKHLYEAL